MLSIVIEINEKETPRVAIKSLLNHLQEIKDLHLIYPLYQNDGESMYKDWSSDRQQLEGAGKRVHFAATLEASDFDVDSLIVRVPPSCELKLGAINMLKKSAEHMTTNQMHFSLIPKAIFTRHSIWNGFFVVLYMMNWIHSLFHWRRLIQYTDVWASFLIKKGKHQYFPPEPNERWWCTDIKRRTLTESASLLQWNNSYQYLIWTLKTHRNFGLGWWMIPYLLTFPAILFPLVFLRQLMFWAILETIVMSTVTWWTTKHYIEMPNMALYCLMVPVYYVLFPVMLIQART